MKTSAAAVAENDERLTTPRQAILRRSDTGVAPEHAREMALVGKSGGERDLHDGVTGPGEPRRGPFHPQPSHVAPDRVAEPSAKRPRQIIGVHPRIPRELGDTRRIEEAVVQTGARPRQPARRQGSPPQSAVL